MVLDNLERKRSKTRPTLLPKVQRQHGRSEQIDKSAKSGQPICSWRSRRGTLQSAASPATRSGRNLKPQQASKSPRLPDKKMPNPDIGARSPKTAFQVAEGHGGKAAVGGDEIARGKETDMRFISVALALAIVTSSAFAQDVGGVGSMRGEGKGRHAAQNSEQQKIDQEKKKAAEDAYKA